MKSISNKRYELQGIPKLIREIPRWFPWRQNKDGKGPINCHLTPPKFANSNNYDHKYAMKGGVVRYASIGKAVNYANRYLHGGSDPYGLSFFLDAADMIAGIDLDDCISEDGVIEDWAVDVCNRLNCRPDYSPSFRGIRTFVRMEELPKRFVKENGFEMYFGNKPLTVTGIPLPGYEGKPVIPTRTRELHEILSEIPSYVDGSTSTKKKKSSDQPTLSEKDLSNLFALSPVAKHLYQKTREYDDRSGIDWGLLKDLAFKLRWPMEKCVTTIELLRERSPSKDKVKHRNYAQNTVDRFWNENGLHESPRTDLPPFDSITSINSIDEEIVVEDGVSASVSTTPTEQRCQLSAVSTGSIADTFPLEVYPPALQEYVRTCCTSIHCPVEYVAVPILSVAGAAIGIAGKQLRVKDGYMESSCIWTAVLDRSGGGKSPALNAAMNFFQEESKRVWTEEDQRSICLSDTTMESLVEDLESGPVLFASDELDAWIKQMGQYKKGGSDKSEWNRIWSHSPIKIGRKTTKRIKADYPFVAVTGMTVPDSLKFFNMGGHENDGFMHRILIAYPEYMQARMTKDGVPPNLTNKYIWTMTKLFRKKGKQILRYSNEAQEMVMSWMNDNHYAELASDTPSSVTSKYKKLGSYLSRISLVIHEIRRVWGDKINPNGVECETVKRAIKVLDFFKSHLPKVRDLLSENDVFDEITRNLNKAKADGRKEITVREMTRKAIPVRNATREQVLGLFGVWVEREYGTVESRPNNQDVFVFASKGDTADS